MSTSKLREAIARELYECWEGAPRSPLSWDDLSEAGRASWLNADETNALLAFVEAEIRPLQEERDQLRKCLSELCGEAWMCGGGDIDGGAFQDLLDHHGVIVEVPADKAFREEWDSDEMYVEAWKADEVRERVKREVNDEEG